MKRVLAAAVQATLLFSLCFFLAYEYFAHDSFSEAIQDAKQHLPARPLTGEVALQSKPPQYVSTMSVNRVPDGPKATASRNVEQGRLSSYTMAATTTSSTETPATNPLQLPEAPFDTSQNDSIAPPEAPFDTSQNDSIAPPERPKNASVYIQSIMHPDDPLFPRLECPSPNHTRYDYLKPPTLLWDPPRPKMKYFFALDLYQCAPILPRLLGSIVETMRFLGPEYCALSIVEGRSTDGTYEILSSLYASINSIGAQLFFVTNDVNPKAGEGTDRIAALANLRNQALSPLTDNPQDYSPETTVLFVNDVALCMEDLLELIHQRIYQNADMTCAMDWIFGGLSFYDVWIARSMNGDQFFEIPQSGTWDFAKNLFWNAPETRRRLDAYQPFQVFSCWNGATAFTAKPVLENGIRFRSSRENECYLGEPTFFCKDMWAAGYKKIAVIPSINVGYDDEESRKTKTRHGSVSSHVEKENEKEAEVPMLIEWETRPPEKIKCVPTYTHPKWVRWNEGVDVARSPAARQARWDDRQDN